MDNKLIELVEQITNADLSTIGALLSAVKFIQNLSTMDAELFKKNYGLYAYDELMKLKWD